MTGSRDDVFVPGRGFVGAGEVEDDAAQDDAFHGGTPYNSNETGPQAATGGTLANPEAVAAYLAEREAVQLEKIAASAERAMGRAPEPTARLRVRALLGLGGPSCTDGAYDRFGR